MSEGSTNHLQNSTLIVAAAVLAGLLSALNTFSAFFDLSLFWADFITGAACFTAAVTWLTSGLRTLKIKDHYRAERSLGANRLKASKLVLIHPKALARIIHELLAPAWPEGVRG